MKQTTPLLIQLAVSQEAAGQSQYTCFTKQLLSVSSCFNTHTKNVVGGELAVEELLNTFGQTIKYARQAALKGYRQLAIATIPKEEFAFVRSNHATICESKHTIDELKELFIQQIHGFEHMYKTRSDKMQIFEVHIKGSNCTCRCETQRNCFVLI